MEYRNTLQKLRKITQLHRFYFNKAVDNKNMYLGQLPIIMYIIEHDACTQKMLVSHFNVSPPCITTSIKRLEKAGYITKRTDEEDGRVNRLHVTKRGQEIAVVMKLEIDAIDKIAFSDFSENEFKTFDQLLNKILSSLSSSDLKTKEIPELIPYVKEFCKKGELE